MTLRDTLYDLKAARVRVCHEIAHQKRMGRPVAHLENDLKRLDALIAEHEADS